MRQAIARLPGSMIREVANAGLGRSDVLAFWFGESDEVTATPVREAAAASLMRGETFYSHNLGLAELRAALRDYTAALHGDPGDDRIVVTSAGVNGLMLAMQLLVDPGDEVLVVAPVWPNLPSQPLILGGVVKRAALRPDAQGAWRLDLQALLASITPATRVLLVNAPNNPTGWTLTRAEQQAILEHCRRTGTWIVADEVYERVWFGPEACAPSFLDIADAADRLIVVHSFSKSFLMTGWRLGWLVLPRGHLDAIGTLIEFNTSCAPVFAQRGALAALASAGESVAPLVAHWRACRDTLCDALAPLPGVLVARPPGGLYAFLQLEGGTDSLGLAKRLVNEHGLGLAPGVAFGPEGEGWLRWCFASRDAGRLLDGVARLRHALGL
ncbi:MAG: pyridoxal phosphate-dependent aminotransferase [Ideonella sp.]|nr:pyridoxal phosphate-dependent aminotransferase [Ideonella sp.]